MGPVASAALQRLAAAGVVVAPATARFQPISVAPFTQIGLTVPSISAAGADVRAADGSVIAQRTMPAKLAGDLGRLCDGAGWRATVSTVSGNYQRSDEVPPWARTPPPFLTFTTSLAEVDLEGVLAFLISVEKDGEHRAEIEAVEPELTIYDALRHDGRRLLTVTGRNVDKGSGLRDLCAALEIDPVTAVAFGDSAVDVPLFRAAGHSVAMPSAARAVREAASRVAPESDDPVGIALQEVFALSRD